MFNSVSSPNFAPQVGQSTLVANHTIAGEPVFTDLAKSLMPFVGLTPLSELFPDETIEERMVVVEQIFESTTTIFPVVEWCKPDLFIDYDGGTMIRNYYRPIPIRQSMNFCYGEINNKIRPGTMNERWSAADQIAEQMRKAMISHNLTWDVFRAMMLLGGIDYTDPRSRVKVLAPSLIPAHNLFSYDTRVGYEGRNEANLFRSLVDYNAEQPATAGVPFTNPDCAIVDCFRRLGRWFKETNKSNITAAYISPELLSVISMNNEIKLALGGVIPKMGAVTGDRKVSNATGGGDLIIPNNLSNPGLTGAVGLGADGDLVTIAGIQLRVVDTVYKDPADGIVKRIFPKNKIVLVSEVDSQGNREAPGRTQFCISEEAGGTPGLWTRTEEQTRIPAAPGFAVQMGNAGLPYLKYPYRVAHLKVAEVRDINTRLGIPGDLAFGTF